MNEPATSPTASFVAGLAGGSASTILLYPLDLIKVRLQVDERRRGSVTRNNAAAERPKTICTTVRGVIRHEGYMGLYRGLTPAVIGSALSWGGFFILYEEIKHKMLQRKRCLAMEELSRMRRSPPSRSETSDRGYDTLEDMHVDEEIGVDTNDSAALCTDSQISLGPAEHFSASCLAGACLVLLTNPIWLIKTRLQLQNSRMEEEICAKTKTVKPPYRGLTHAAITIVREEGFLALYKGSIPALFLVSHGGIQFVTYEFLKSQYAMYNEAYKPKKSSGRNRGTVAERLRDSLGYLVMGAASKFVASTATYPLQVIKSRLQQRSQVVEVSESTGEVVVSKRNYAGVMDCITRILKNEGVTGCFKGCITNAIRVAPSAAITFVTYEFILDMLT